MADAFIKRCQEEKKNSLGLAHKTQMKKFMGYIFQLMKGVDKRVGGKESEPEVTTIKCSH